METKGIIQRLMRPRTARVLNQTLVVAVLSVSGCSLDGATKPSLRPEVHVDPSVAARLKAERFTGAVISYVNLSDGSVRSRPSRAASFSKPTTDLRIASTLLVPSSAAMTMDLTSDLCSLFSPQAVGKRQAATRSSPSNCFGIAISTESITDASEMSPSATSPIRLWREVAAIPGHIPHRSRLG